MSLIKCIECGSEISSFSDKCPKCGCPTKISIVGNSFKPLKEKEHRSCSGKEDYLGKLFQTILFFLNSYIHTKKLKDLLMVNNTCLFFI